MAKPWIHAQASARRFGGVPEDYIEIHEFLDTSKSAVPDNRHRIFTHNAWFIFFIPERVFGRNVTNSDGREVSVREICEQHVQEDFGGFIPSAQDWVQALEMQGWMNNGRGGVPPSFEGIERTRKVVKVMSFDND